MHTQRTLSNLPCILVSLSDARCSGLFKKEYSWMSISLLGRGKSQECSEWQDCPLNGARVGRISITEEEGMAIGMIIFSSWIGSQNV